MNVWVWVFESIFLLVSDKLRICLLSLTAPACLINLPQTALCANRWSDQGGRMTGSQPD